MKHGADAIYLFATSLEAQTADRSYCLNANASISSRSTKNDNCADKYDVLLSTEDLSLDTHTTVSPAGTYDLKLCAQVP